MSWLLPEKVVDLVVGLGDHLRSPGSAPPVSFGGLLLRWGVDQGGQISGSEVCQLDCQLGILQDGISKDLLVPQSDVGVAFEHLGVLANVWATGQLTAGADVLKVEEATMFVALCPNPK